MAPSGFTEYFSYSHQQTDLFDFSRWLEEFVASELFSSRKARYLALYQQLALAEDEETRRYLRQEAHLLAEAFIV